ncbi:unnamed protein product [Didymodactylos carnosus]|uniref:Uncharacterized protein n=1 Tax=Didymodactylos carnosus TaxID=1234261 RepID=A0A814VZH1_9BILA|nr:unnamed protein product [Didymodactylos carnosus]CAF3959283.1 unnamed protein product [Didymodactylos carnosus]
MKSSVATHSSPSRVSLISLSSNDKENTSLLIELDQTKVHDLSVVDDEQQKNRNEELQFIEYHQIALDILQKHSIDHNYLKEIHTHPNLMKFLINPDPLTMGNRASYNDIHEFVTQHLNSDPESGLYKFICRRVSQQLVVVHGRIIRRINRNARHVYRTNLKARELYSKISTLKERINHEISKRYKNHPYLKYLLTDQEFNSIIEFLSDTDDNSFFKRAPVTEIYLFIRKYINNSNISEMSRKISRILQSIHQSLLRFTSKDEYKKSKRTIIVSKKSTKKVKSTDKKVDMLFISNYIDKVSWKYSRLAKILEDDTVIDYLLQINPNTYYTNLSLNFIKLLIEKNENETCTEVDLKRIQDHLLSIHQTYLHSVIKI